MNRIKKKNTEFPFNGLWRRIQLQGQEEPKERERKEEKIRIKKYKNCNRQMNAYKHFNLWATKNSNGDVFDNVIPVTIKWQTQYWTTERKQETHLISKNLLSLKNWIMSVCA